VDPVSRLQFLVFLTAITKHSIIIYIFGHNRIPLINPIRMMYICYIKYLEEHMSSCSLSGTGKIRSMWAARSRASHASRHSDVADTRETWGKVIRCTGSGFPESRGLQAQKSLISIFYFIFVVFYSLIRFERCIIYVILNVFKGLSSLARCRGPWEMTSSILMFDDDSVASFGGSREDRDAREA